MLIVTNSSHKTCTQKNNRLLPPTFWPHLLKQPLLSLQYILPDVFYLVHISDLHTCFTHTSKLIHSHILACYKPIFCQVWLAYNFSFECTQHNDYLRHFKMTTNINLVYIYHLTQLGKKKKRVLLRFTSQQLSNMQYSFINYSKTCFLIYSIGFKKHLKSLFSGWQHLREVTN